MLKNDKKYEAWGRYAYQLTCTATARPGKEDMGGKTGLASATYRVLSDASPTMPTPHDAPGTQRSISDTLLIIVLLW